MQIEFSEAGGDQYHELWRDLTDFPLHSGKGRKFTRGDESHRRKIEKGQMRGNLAFVWTEVQCGILSSEFTAPRERGAFYYRSEKYRIPHWTSQSLVHGAIFVHFIPDYAITIGWVMAFSRPLSHSKPLICLQYESSESHVYSVLGDVCVDASSSLSET